MQILRRTLLDYLGFQGLFTWNSEMRPITSDGLPINFFTGDVEFSSPQYSLNSSEGLSGVPISTYSSPAIKKAIVSSHLRHMVALDIINSISNDAMEIDADGSNISDQVVSGIYMDTPQETLSLKKTSSGFLLSLQKVPPNHHWYVGNRPGLALAFKCDRCSQTTLSHIPMVTQVPLLFIQQKDALHQYKMSRSPGFSPMHVALHGSHKLRYQHRSTFLLDFLRVNDLMILPDFVKPRRIINNNKI
ncbi:hypothetical protein TNCV_209151 [Trichonephila clavipes]|uniref:Uncharacterized protein n=1 Tax=Trichonephila clavipes TaxID=2585209 RepID=A0A8X6T750_TRICX|nr:hypothetical protein TNCV_209151 [Trichonephila clavipes]